jgi:hypothetical protein
MNTDAGWGPVWATVSGRAAMSVAASRRAATVTAFVTRALAWYTNLGIHPRRIMTDNAWPTPKIAPYADSLPSTASPTC